MHLHFGLNLAWDLAFRKMYCELDSTEALRLSTDPSIIVFHVHGAIIADIKTLVHRSWQVQLSHVYREVNSSVDAMAKSGTSQLDDVIVWQSPPSDLLNP